MQISLGDHTPSVSASAWVAPNATLVGDITVGERCSIFYGAVLRAEFDSITIGDGSNVQDNAVFHVDNDFPIVIGEGVTIGHAAVVHGATIEDHALVGMNATVMNGAHIGAETLIAGGAVVPEGMKVPPRSLVAGVPAKVRRELTDAEVAGLHRNGPGYERISAMHAEALAQQ
ncbi:gamma carbonic anhydrase family protein [Nocardioides alcanivorans]|uniref:gamma carbonic anhydrase family protein n=1 Tax=Nocardioides alcanivorans TaxID=2897352 RepID=UPI001F23EB35|nr:gamma carbonic anhydrase family protein [Nocardioides alcanivorans]